mgnify:CR=1 FL=1
MPRMDTTTDSPPTPDHIEASPLSGATTADPPAVSRRGFLHSAAVAGGGLVAMSVVACAPASSRPAWSYGPSLPSGAPAPSTGAPAPSAAPSMDHAPSASPSGPADPSGSPSPTASTEPPVAIPAGWSEHDVAAKMKVDRFLAAEYDQLPAPNAVLEPTLDGDVKVFELTCQLTQWEHAPDVSRRFVRYGASPRGAGRAPRPHARRARRRDRRSRPSCPRGPRAR